MNQENQKQFIFKYIKKIIYIILFYYNKTVKDTHVNRDVMHCSSIMKIQEFQKHKKKTRN